jgi:hypothetical protein
VTLQVHVRIDDPDQALRPELQVEVRFALAAERGAAASDKAGGAPGSLFTIPQRLVIDGDGATSVWVVDGASGRAALRRITVAARSGDRTNGRAIVGAGLHASDKLIESLDPGGPPLTEGAPLELVAGAAGGR